MSEVLQGREVATLAGGCFWCLEAVYDQLRGVDDVVSGYAGGRVRNPSYQAVCAGTTGHAEVVQVTFDPAVVSFREILEVFFTVHDPTTLNRQGADVGTQYRSAIFYRSPEQKATAEQVISEINAAKIWPAPHRDRGLAVRDVLPGGGLSPGVLCAQPDPGVLQLRHRAEGCEVQKAVSESA